MTGTRWIRQDVLYSRLRGFRPKTTMSLGTDLSTTGWENNQKNVEFDTVVPNTLMAMINGEHESDPHHRTSSYLTFPEHSFHPQSPA